MRFARLSLICSLSLFALAVLTGCRSAAGVENSLPAEFTAHVPLRVSPGHSPAASENASVLPQSLTPVTSSPPENSRGDGGPRITILHTNDGRGEIDPCG